MPSSFPPSFFHMPPHLQSASICCSLSSDSISTGVMDKYHHLRGTVLSLARVHTTCKHSPRRKDVLSGFKGCCVSRCNDLDLSEMWQLCQHNIQDKYMDRRHTKSCTLRHTTRLFWKLGRVIMHPSKIFNSFVCSFQSNWRMPWDGLTKKFEPSHWKNNTEARQYKYFMNLHTE